RGLIFASDGHTVLASNVRRKAGGQTLYFRVYPTHGFASQAVGYSTQSRSRAGVEREENAYLTASNKSLGTIFDTLGDRLRRATQGLYPPGSTFKTITAAAALDDGVFTPDSTFYDPGYCTEYGKQVKNALDQSGGSEAFGHVNFVQAYQHSINAVFCMIGQKLGAQRVLDESKKFGFYSTPPLETPTDARSPSGLYNGTNLFNPRNANNQVDPGRLAFGQERMLVTPLQMALVA